MRAARRGDARAYARVLGDLAGVLRALFRRRLGGPDVEDYVQDVLLAIHLKGQTWDEARPLMPWVFAIAQHKLADGLRRTRRVARHVSADLTIDMLAESIAEPPPEHDRVGLDVERHLATLSGRQRAVVRALTLEERSVAETAILLAMSEGAVRVALHRGLKALAERARAADRTGSGGHA